MKYLYKKMQSPVGELTLVGSKTGLAAILWEDDDPQRVKITSLEHGDNYPLLVETEKQLAAYFAGELRYFSLPYDVQGTCFQKQVWQALMTIPYGETRSYKQIAIDISKPTAIRAVGGAIGRNPLSIVVPCHRVIGANGQLTGFAGGLAAKTYLLALEIK
ncbi:MAG: methylated-DNA--[protein]-cysteine S-methyltransferase [bacterium]|nr:methylated-DNA--[protein]-cysteine S-methyltransferase [bacterium]